MVAKERDGTVTDPNIAIQLHEIADAIGKLVAMGGFALLAWVVLHLL